jgi:serine/threonine protein kinase
LINYNDYDIRNDLSGHYLGNYRLIRLLGHGGFASVYLGEHQYLKRMAAIKVLHTILAEQEKDHFLTEAQLLANLSHPRIIRVLEFAVAPRRTYIQNSVVIENIPFLVMDYVKGGNLRSIYPMGTRLFLDTVTNYIYQIADALQYAHNQRIIHRDIKPENLLLNERQEVMLSDFGLALFAPVSRLLSGQDTAGTIPYTAPEQLRGKPRFASDQYSLGILAYEWLSGYPPFRGGEAEIILQHISSPPPRLRNNNASISPAVEDVILRALAKDPEQRYASVQDFGQALLQASRMPQSYKIVEQKREEAPLPAGNVFPFFYYFSQKPMATNTGTTGGNAPIYTLDTDLKRKIQYPVSMTPSKQRNRQRMIQKVRTFWISGVLEPSLYETPFITPELRERQDAVNTPWPSMAQQAQKHHPAVLSSSTSITEIYDQSGGELLILGEAGSGKTTLLLQLARTLLDRAEQDESTPIPVIFPLSSWPEQQLPIEQWLIEELQNKYQIPRLLSGMWLRSDILLPLLDGLDEVTESARSACIIAINTYKQEHGLSPLVVCSRLTEYLLFPPRVILQRAVVVQSLTMQQITDYFLNAGEKFQFLYQFLRADPLLQRLITTPLMLNIITIAYKDKSPAELLKMQSSTESYRQIFHTYVEHMLQRHPALASTLSHTPQELISWLGSLARKMQQHGQVVFYIEELQPEWIDKFRWRQVYMWLAVLLPGALIGALAGLLSNDVLFHAGDFKAILLDSLYGLLMGFLFSGRKAEQIVPARQPVMQNAPQKGRFMGRLLLTPLFLGVISILFLAQAKGLPDGLLNGTFLGVMCLPMSILLQKKVDAKNGRTLINRGPKRSLSQHPLFEHLTNGLIVGPVCGISNILTNVIRQGISHYSPAFYLTLGIRETLHNFLIGMLISLLLLHMNDGTIHRAEIIVWSWKRFWNSFRIPKNTLIGIGIGIIAGLTYGLKETFGGSLTNGISDGLTDTLFLMLGYSFVSAILRGFSSYNLANHHRYKPNEGIRRSLYHGLIGSLIGALIGIIGYIFSSALYFAIIGMLTSFQPGNHKGNALHGIIVGFQQGLHVDIHDMLLLAVASGLLIGLLLGGLAALQHGILRIILWKTKVLPLRLAGFLDYATGSILLHKVGGGFMFIHRFLLEYFVSLQQKTYDEQKTSPDADRLVRLL